MISKRGAQAILLLEGLASSGVQMIVIRQTVPFLGSSVVTTSIVIACFLAALALGYYYGGKQREQNYHRKLSLNIVLSTAIFGIGLSYSFVSWFFLSIADLTQTFAILSNPLAHLFLYALLIMSPLVFFLAQTVPLLINTSSKETRKSEAAGNATAISTIGNVVGCLLTSLVLMYFFGVGYSIFLNCIFLVFCLFFILDLKVNSDKYIVGACSSILVVTYFLNVYIPNRIFVETTPYSNFYVKHDTDGNRLVVNRSSASFLSNDDKRKGWPYIELIKRSIFDSTAKGKDILVLGAGGFTLSAKSDHHTNIVYLDIDEKIKNIAENEFLKEPIKGKFISQDARNYLLTNGNRQWDNIVVDLYSNAATIPAHVSTFEFFSLVGSRLKNDGVAILNIVANPTLNDDYSANMDFTIRSAFSRCITDMPDHYNDSLVNIVYFCQKKSIKSVATIYRDDTTRVAVDSYMTSLQTKTVGRDNEKL